MKWNKLPVWTVGICVFLFAGPCRGETGESAEAQIDSVRRCSGPFGRGWNDQCLLNKLRDPAYLGVGWTDVSDAQLLEFIRGNREAIIGLLAQIDWGRDVDRFISGRTTTLSTENEKVLVATSDRVRAVTLVLEQLARLLNAPHQSTAFTAASESLSVLRQILFAFQVYYLAAQVVISHGERTVLSEYIDYRRNASSEGAWRAIRTTPAYERSLLQISRVKRIPLERLDKWFENAYAAYRLVALPNSGAIRREYGLTIARLASRISKVYVVFPEIPSDAQITPMGVFTNLRDTQEHASGYKVELWRYNTIVFGLFSVAVGPQADFPAGLLENVKFAPLTGRLSFLVKLSTHVQSDGSGRLTGSEELYAFDGSVGDGRLSGTLRYSENCAYSSDEQIELFVEETQGSSWPSTYGEWKRTAEQILHFRGPRWSSIITAEECAEKMGWGDLS